LAKNIREEKRINWLLSYFCQ